MLSNWVENATRTVLKLRTYLREAPAVRIYDFTPYLITLSAFVTLAIAQVQRVFQSPSDRGLVVTLLGIVGLLVAVIMLLINRLLHRQLHPLIGLEEKQEFLAKILILSIQVGILLLPISAYFAVWQSHYDQLAWYVYGFLDKRFVLSLYWTAIATFLVLPPVLWKILDRPNLTTLSTTDHPEVSPHPKVITNSRVRFFAKVLLPILIACFMYGPPWNLQQLPIGINYHEQINLGPLQAIDKGYLPDIGPASQQYGPGFQLAMYALMKLSGQFTLFGFRQAQATLIFFAYALFALITFQLLEIPYALLAALVFSLTVSPFNLIGWAQTDSLVIWGWPNPLRYMGSLLLLVLLPALLTAHKQYRFRFVMVGVLWGLFIWLSPENLVMGIISSGLLCVFLWATSTVTFRKILYDVVLVGLGVGVFWLPFAIFYLVQGRLGEYLSNIFLVGSQVLNGFSDTPPASDLLTSPHLSNIAYFALPLLILVGLLILFTHVTLSQGLDKKRLYLLALISVTLASLSASLTRSDAAHLLNPLIGLPILMGLLIQDFPKIISPNLLVSSLMRVVVIIVIFMFATNYGSANYSFLSFQLYVRLGRFLSTSSYPTTADNIPDGIAFKRTGYETVSDNTLLVISDGVLSESQNAISFTAIANTLDEVRTLVGTSRVYVYSFPYIQPGLVYFLDDLTPPPVYADPDTMVFSNEERAKFLAQFKGIANQVDYIVTTDPKIPEVGLFMAAHPNAISMKRTLGDQDVFIFGIFQADEVKLIKKW